MKKSQRTADILAVSLLISLLVVAFLARSPYAVKVPLRDSGIFLHIGSDVLHGKVLYQETWDSKQPLLYVINAVGLWLGGGSIWGVWGLELALFGFVFLASYRLTRSSLMPLPSIVVIAIAFLAVFPFMGGNYSEEYSIVVQVGILSLLFEAYLPNRYISRPLASTFIGMLVGFVFCIKQTYLDIPATVVIFMVFLSWVEQDRRILRNLLFVGMGFLLVNVPIFIYFQMHGALRDYVIDAFLFNLYYTHMSTLERINSILEKIKFISSHPFFVLVTSLWLGVFLFWLVKMRNTFARILNHPYARRLVMTIALVCFTLFIVAQVTGHYPRIGYLQGVVLAAGIICGAASLFLYLIEVGARHPDVLSMDFLRKECLKSNWSHPGPATFLFLGLIDFPIVLFTIALPGKPWTHYYVTLFPAIVLLLAGCLAYLYRNVVIPMKQPMFNCLLIGVLAIGSFPPLNQVVTALSKPTGVDGRSMTAEYLKSVTAPGDPILVWGWESVIYFLSERESPTRFALPFALYLDTPYQDEFADILLAEVKARPPAYIVDLMEPSMPLIGGRPAETCLSGNNMYTQRMVDFLAFICANYVPDRDFDTINIYKQRIDN